MPQVKDASPGKEAAPAASKQQQKRVGFGAVAAQLQKYEISRLFSAMLQLINNRCENSLYGVMCQDVAGSSKRPVTPHDWSWNRVQRIHFVAFPNMKATARNLTSYLLTLTSMRHLHTAAALLPIPTLCSLPGPYLHDPVALAAPCCQECGHSQGRGSGRCARWRAVCAGAAEPRHVPQAHGRQAGRGPDTAGALYEAGRGLLWQPATAMMASLLPPGQVVVTATSLGRVHALLRF